MEYLDSFPHIREARQLALTLFVLIIVTGSDTYNGITLERMETVLGRICQMTPGTN